MKYLFILVFLIGIQEVFCQTGGDHPTLLFSTKEMSRVAIDSIYYYPFKAIDSNGNTLSYFVKELPFWLHFNPAIPAVSGKPVKRGQFPVQLFVSNGKDTVGQYFMITVFDHETTNILCLGNSLTNGTSIFNSYRRSLWQMLYASNYNFDFIGSWSKHHMGGKVPDPDFDMDHEGHSGWTIQNFFSPPDWDSTRGNIQSWLKTYTPGIVLVELGTNDVFQCRKVVDMISDFSRMVRLLRQKNKKVKIFIAQIPPLGPKWSTQKLCGNDTTYDRAIRNLNKNIAAFAKMSTTPTSAVIVVDQFSGIDPSASMYDDIHPNDLGEKLMAERWFKAIRPYLNKLH